MTTAENFHIEVDEQAEIEKAEIDAMTVIEKLTALRNIALNAGKCDDIRQDVKDWTTLAIQDLQRERGL